MTDFIPKLVHVKGIKAKASELWMISELWVNSEQVHIKWDISCLFPDEVLTDSQVTGPVKKKTS